MKATIRDWSPEDDLAALTAMLHRAYAPLAAMGLRYTATHQTPEVTRDRLSRGRGFIAEHDGRIVGTLTVYPPNADSSVSAYRDAETCHFGQFGVDPDHQGSGIGRELHQLAVAETLSQGRCYLALDTAAPASHLIAKYERWGYVTIERTSFTTTNYESVIMRLTLA